MRLLIGYMRLNGERVFNDIGMDHNTQIYKLQIDDIVFRFVISDRSLEMGYCSVIIKENGKTMFEANSKYKGKPRDTKITCRIIPNEWESELKLEGIYISE